MKKSFLFILAFLPIICFAQKVNTQIDDFTGEKVITTSWEKIYSGGATGKNQTRIRFRHEGGTDFIEFRIFTDCVASCDKGKEILLKTNSNIIKVYNLEYTLTKPGDWNPNGINNKLGIYLTCSSSELNKLSNESVTKMRITLSDGYRDLELKEKDSSKLQSLYNQFNQAK
ncbi:hypothetical protein KSZ35_09415 [Bacteroides xylanisolvens]|uniref:hypothetical protein n=1 Tax=Bacteroides TaxID=816 RepID=UPI0011453409|nr:MULTISPECIES: hypothetical protein [Bacteroides]MBV4220919.1 hypothetical protein [Bacteroides xylanisolvens]